MSVPFSFDLENEQRKKNIDRVVSVASVTRIANVKQVENFATDLVQDLGDGRGRGVFAGRRYAKGELVAEWPYQMVPVEDVPVGMKDYMYKAKRARKHAIVYGHGYYLQLVPNCC